MRLHLAIVSCALILNITTAAAECERTRCSEFVSSNDDEQLQTAVVNNKTDMAQRALAQGALVNACGEDYRRPLHWAAIHNNPLLVKSLLKAQADPNVQDCPGNTPLVYAAEADDTQVASLLLSAGAAIDAPESDITPLQMAASHGRVTMLHFLLSRGANPNAVRNDSTALLYAVRLHQLGAVKVLLHAGASPDMETSYGLTPLYKAVEDGQLQIVKALLDAGADPQAKFAGWNVVDRAEAKGYKEIAELIRARKRK